MGIADRPVNSTILYKEDGTPVLVGSPGEIVVAPLSEAVARGLVTGASGMVSGYVGVAAASIVSIRATIYTEQAVGLQRELRSSVASDSAAGTGARVVRITYYDATMAGPFTEDVTMNGTTAVATVATDICFIESLKVQTVGSAGTNNGTVTLRLLSGGATIGTIAASDGMTFWAHHYVAAGRMCFVTAILTGLIDTGLLGSLTGGIFLRKARPLTANSFEEQMTPTLRVDAAASATHPMDRGLFVVGPARVTMYARPDSTTAGTVHGGFEYYDI